MIQTSTLSSRLQHQHDDVEMLTRAQRASQRSIHAPFYPRIPRAGQSANLSTAPAMLDCCAASLPGRDAQVAVERGTFQLSSL
jgi:hypothetical protein